MFQCRLDLPAELRTEVVLPLQVRQWLLQLPARGIMVSQPWAPLLTFTKAATRGDPLLLDSILTDTVIQDIKDPGQDTDQDLVTDHMGDPETAPQVVQVGLRASILATQEDSTLHKAGTDLLPI